MYYFEAKIGIDNYIIISSSRKRLEIIRKRLLKREKAEIGEIRRADFLMRKVR